MWKFQSGEGDESKAVIDYVVNKMYEKYGKPLAILSQNRITRTRIKADLNRVFGTLMSIAEGACPAEMTLGPKEINYTQWMGPARMDLALTYRCDLNCSKCYVGHDVARELTTNEWLEIYCILWNLGIPQVVFTGGEPLQRNDIVELVSEADEFVTGLITNGTKLAELAKPLRNASLDYAQVTIESFDPKIHDAMTCTPGSHTKTVEGIQEALKAELQVVTNTTLTKANTFGFVETIRFLSGIGVRHVACNTIICSGRGTTHKVENGLSDEELKPSLEKACETAADLGVILQWYSPTCYNIGIDPIELGFGVKACSAAAHNMTIQPDGTVLPCQSWPDVVGNILTDPWKSIWEHPTCLKLRQGTLKDEKCQDCKFVAECGGGCPLDKSERGPS
ncbi:radical SAM protein [Patescibacteria group bacterium]